MKISTLLLTLAVVLIFTSCEKNDENNLPDNSHRLLRAYMEKGGNQYIDSLFYRGEKLTHILTYSNSGNETWALSDKSEISYIDNRVNILESHFESSHWVPVSRNIVTLEHGLVTEEVLLTYHNETWILGGKSTYEYSGGALMSFQSYEPNEYGEFIFTNKVEYSYLNGKLNKSIDYFLHDDAWDPQIKTTYLYDGGHLVNLTKSNRFSTDDWFQHYKSDFLYTGNHVSQMDELVWIRKDSVWRNVQSSAFAFSGSDFLSKISIESISFESNIHITYEYEDGNGNEKLFYYYYPGQLIEFWPDVNRNSNYVPYYKRISYLQ